MPSTAYTAAIAAALLLLPAVSVQAQMGGPPGGMPNLDPAVLKKIQALQRWDQSHKRVSEVRQTLLSLMEMDREPKTRLTAAQSKKLLPVLTAWGTRPTMTEAQAADVSRQLTGSLTVAQIKKLATITSRSTGPGRRGGGAGMDGPPPGMGGPGSGGGAPPRMPTAAEIPTPREYNPLNPNTLPVAPMRAQMKPRYTAFIVSLKQRAAAAKGA